MRKGVSTIIAMVLLIVITIAVAVILKGWYLENIQRNEMLVQQMTDQKIGQMTEELKATSYDFTNRYLYVQNTGTATVQIKDPADILLIKSYENSIPVTWTWQYWSGAAWVPYANNGVVKPGDTMRAWVPNPGLQITREYQITTPKGYAYTFVYGIGSVLLTANPQSRIANNATTNGTTTENRIFLVATVYDNFGNPLPGQTVNFEVTSGALNPSSFVTGATGMANSAITPPGTPGDAIARAYVTLPNGANVSGYANIAYTPALQITSFVINWTNAGKTTGSVTMVVRNNTLGQISSVAATFSLVGPTPSCGTCVSLLAAPSSQNIPAGTTRTFTRAFSWVGVASGTYTFYFTATADTASIHSPQSVSNTLTKVV